MGDAEDPASTPEQMDDQRLSGVTSANEVPASEPPGAPKPVALSRGRNFLRKPAVAAGLAASITLFVTSLFSLWLSARWNDQVDEITHERDVALSQVAEAEGLVRLAEDRQAAAQRKALALEEALEEQMWFPPNRGGFGYAASPAGTAVLVS